MGKIRLSLSKRTCIHETLHIFKKRVEVSGQREEISFSEVLGTNGTFVPHLPPQGSRVIMTEGVERWQQPEIEEGAKPGLLHVIGLLHSRAHGSCGCLYKVRTAKSLAWSGRGS